MLLFCRLSSHAAGNSGKCTLTHGGMQLFVYIFQLFVYIVCGDLISVIFQILFVYIITLILRQFYGTCSNSDQLFVYVSCLLTFLALFSILSLSVFLQFNAK